MTEALPLPEDFDSQTYMIAQTTENGVFHESRKGAALAARLVANGTPQNLALAERVLEVVLGCQERRAGDPHCGNFFWMLEDDVVQDLNAVEFNLEHLIPVIGQHGDRLSPDLRARVLEAIRLGLDEIRRLDVLVVYSNIAMLDILNTCLGGELLGEAWIAARGYRKLVEWMARTCAHGIPYEYNSPTYTAVTIRALDRLARLVQDADTRIRARTALARLGLSAALHIHAGTGRWAGPHSRAYQPSVVCETAPEVEMMRRWIAVGALPASIADALTQRPAAFEVVETAFAERDLSITTYHSPSFALGVSTKEFSGQSNVLMVHYARPGAERPGVVYSRYLTDDKWLGDFYHATDRTKSRNLVDEGLFYGVQQGPRAVGLHTPREMGTVRYLGPRKSFWELNWPGAFYRGRPQCGVYVEAAERVDYADGRAFAETVAAGALRDITAPPFTYQGEGERLWSVEYTRDEQMLGIAVDLMAWALERRWTDAGDLGWPMIESPVARETRTGRVALGGATLTCGPEAEWLFASPATGRWVAAYHGRQPAPLTLSIPGETIEVPAMGTGTVVWDNGQVTIEAVGVQGA